MTRGNRCSIGERLRAQVEHAATFTEPFPTGELLDRMADLCRRRDLTFAAVKNNRFWVNACDDGPWNGLAFRQITPARRIHFTNLLTQAELRLADIEREIVHVARLIVAEADNGETLLAGLQLREQQETEAKGESA